MATSNSTTARSGSEGFAMVGTALIARVTQWTLNSLISESAWGDSDSEGYTNRKGARKDGNGQIAGKLDETSPQYNVVNGGDVIDLTLWEDGADTTPSTYWNFPCALITQFSFTYDQDTKEVVGWTADFGADGKFYKPGDTGIPSKTFPSS